MIATNLSPIDWMIVTIMVAFFGACVGSFLNVCIYRIPRELSTIRPRSHCPSCNRLIPWFLNIPVLSYALLRGRCRYCQAPIAFRYILVELLMALLFLMVWLRFVPFATHPLLGMTPITDGRLVPVYWLFTAGLVLGSFIDFEHMIIPDRCTLGGLVAGILLSPVIPAMHHAAGRLEALYAALIGAIVGWGILWMIAHLGSLAFRKEAMGFGDVKLMGAIGAFLGWRAAVFTIMVSSLIGTMAGVGLMIAGRGKLQSRIPYGPYLSLAALIWLFWGPSLWSMYVGLLGAAPY